MGTRSTRSDPVSDHLLVGAFVTDLVPRKPVIRARRPFDVAARLGLLTAALGRSRRVHRLSWRRPHSSLGAALKHMIANVAAGGDRVVNLILHGLNDPGFANSTGVYLSGVVGVDPAVQRRAGRRTVTSTASASRTRPPLGQSSGPASACLHIRSGFADVGLAVPANDGKAETRAANGNVGPLADAARGENYRHPW